MAQFQLQSAPIGLVAHSENITPWRAQELLERMGINRPLVEKRVQMYLSAMKDGRWKNNGQPIIITKSGRLDNGMHRLTAIVRLGSPVEMLVVYGVDDDVFDTIDTGKSRSASDILHIDGAVSTTALAAAIRVVISIQKQTIDSNLIISPQELRAWYENNRNIADSVRATITSSKWLGHGLAAGLHFLFSRKDPQTADKFFSDLVHGTNLSTGDGIWALRERLLQNSLNKAKISRTEKIVLGIRAWNARRQNTVVRMLKGSYNTAAAPYPPIL